MSLVESRLIQSDAHSFEQTAKNATAAMQESRDRLCLHVLLVFKSSPVQVRLRTAAFSMLVCHKSQFRDLM